MKRKIKGTADNEKACKITQHAYRSLLCQFGELYMILTVHGSDHKNQNASNIINEYRRDRQTG